MSWAGIDWRSPFNSYSPNSASIDAVGVGLGAPDVTVAPEELNNARVWGPTSVATSAVSPTPNFGDLDVTCTTMFDDLQPECKVVAKTGVLPAGIRGVIHFDTSPVNAYTIDTNKPTTQTGCSSTSVHYADGSADFNGVTFRLPAATCKVNISFLLLRAGGDNPLTETSMLQHSGSKEVIVSNTNYFYNQETDTCSPICQDGCTCVFANTCVACKAHHMPVGAIGSGALGCMWNGAQDPQFGTCTPDNCLQCQGPGECAQCNIGFDLVPVSNNRDQSNNCVQSSVVDDNDGDDESGDPNDNGGDSNPDGNDTGDDSDNNTNGDESPEAAGTATYVYPTSVSSFVACAAAAFLMMS